MRCTSPHLTPHRTQLDGPVVVRALLQRDLSTLSLHVGPEMMERLEGIFKHEAERVSWCVGGWYVRD
jgi:hypothetical protein